jgi:hypothetical protein
MNRIQWERALRLAQSYGHDWASWALGYDDWDRAIEAIEEASPGTSPQAWPDPVPVAVPSDWRQARERWERERQGGDDRRDWGLRPNWAHVTTTGRTAWCVRPDGSVRIDIDRPGGTVLTATVAGLPDGPASRSWQPTLQSFGAWSYRHADALALALRVCLGLGPEELHPAEVLSLTTSGYEPDRYDVEQYGDHVLQAPWRPR